MACRGGAAEPRASSFDLDQVYKPASPTSTPPSATLKGGIACWRSTSRSGGAARASAASTTCCAAWAALRGAGEPTPTSSAGFERRPAPARRCVDRQIAAPTTPSWSRSLRHVGLELRTSSNPGQLADGASAVWARRDDVGQQGQPAWSTTRRRRGGPRAGDEIIALDGFRSPAGRAPLAGRGRCARRPIELEVFRRARLIRLPAFSSVRRPRRATRSSAWATRGRPRRRYHAWLGEPHPGVQLIGQRHHDGRWV